VKPIDYDLRYGIINKFSHSKPWHASIKLVQNQFTMIQAMDYGYLYS
jgi:hypothetical protein